MGGLILGGRGSRPPRKPVRVRRAGLGGLGAGPWDNFNAAQFTERCNPGLKSQAGGNAQQIMSAFTAADAALTKAERDLTLASDRLSTVGFDPVADYEAAQLEDDLSFAIDQVSDLRRELGATFDDFSNSMRSAFDSNFCPLVPGAGIAQVDQFLPKIKQIQSAAAALTGDLKARVASTERAIVARIDRENKQRAAAEAAQLAAEQRAIREAEEARRLAELEAERERLRLEAEERARQREYELQQQALEEQRRREEREAEAIAREEARRAEAEERRLAAEERARQMELDRIRMQEEAEERRRQLELEAQQRREAQEQERILREEQRRLRAEEREAELERLTLMQELAASGLPLPVATPAAGPATAFAYPGAAAAQLPASIYGQQLPAGFTTPPGFQSPALVPGAPQVTAYPGAPGAAPVQQQIQPFQQSAPLPFQQSAPLQPSPAMPAPAPGFQWASFDPAGELFGMGPITTAPKLNGGMIEEGFKVYGPNAQGDYTFFNPDGQRISVKTMAGRTTNLVTEDEIMAGPIMHEVNGQQRVIYSPPSDGGSGAGDGEIAAATASILSSIAQATGNVLVAREQRKAAEKSGDGYQVPGMPSLTIRQEGPQGLSPLVVVGGLAVAALGTFAVIKVATRGKGKE